MTEQLASIRVQVVELKLPEPLLLKVTVPVGVTFVPADVSVTVAVHVEAMFTGSVAGVQVTVGLVERWLAMRLKLLELVE